MLASLSLLSLSLAGAASAKPLSTTPRFEARRDAPLAVAPLHTEFHPHGSVNGSYIVVLKDDVTDLHLKNHMHFLAASAMSYGDDGVSHVYDGHLKGYAGKFDANTLDALRAMPEVAYVEQDQLVHTMEVQTSAPWGLARISHPSRLTFSTFTKYLYNKQGGEGVDVYVIDTGINIDHVEFEGRAIWGKTMPQNDVDEDGNGHGTHCAGTIASRKYGVAKGANVIAVKVLGSNGSGTMSDVVGGVIWATKAAEAKAEAAKAEFRRTGKTAHKGSVANMSLGGGKSRALDQAVNAAVTKGMHFAVAAGNDNQDACKYSPAAAENAVTVGASTLGDERAYFSNHGTCVDVFAPGLNILSTWTGSKTAINTISGTSMASPHTAGLLAYLLSLYPSKEFDPVLDSSLADGAPDLAASSVPAPFADAYRAAHAVLPGWAARFLPEPAFLLMEDASVGPKTITPLQLKKALLALAGRDKLETLPAGSPNLLIFNNATA